MTNFDRSFVEHLMLLEFVFGQLEYSGSIFEGFIKEKVLFRGKILSTKGVKLDPE